MKISRIAVPFFIGLTIFLQYGCNTRKDEPPPAPPGDSLQQVDTSAIHMEWKTVAGAMMVKISAPTTGWIAAGYDPAMGMQGANILIGFVRNDTAYMEDDYGSSPGSHAPDIGAGGTDDITVIAGHENAGRTELQFIIPLDSGDGRDRTLTAGNTYRVILAYGEDNADDFTSYHKFRIVVEVKI